MTAVQASQLNSGLQVVVISDATATAATVSAGYKVGSAEDLPAVASGALAAEVAFNDHQRPRGMYLQLP